MEIIDPVSGRADSGPIGENAALGPQEGETASKVPSANREVPLIPAGFLRRAIAFFIDLFIVQGFYLILMVVGVMGIRFSMGGERGFFLLGEVPPSIGAPFITGWFFLFVGYFTFFHSYNGQTPAKMIIRIKVVTIDGKGLSPFQAMFRALGYFLSGFFFGFGFFVSIFERRKRALHDLLTHSQVVLSP